MDEQQGQIYSNLIIATTGLITAFTALLVAIKTWWEVCKTQDAFLKEARRTIAERKKVNDTLETGAINSGVRDTRITDLEARQTVLKVGDEEIKSAEWKAVTDEGVKQTVKLEAKGE